MKIRESYSVKVHKNGYFYTFKSNGKKGTIQKWIWFQTHDNIKYNLAFGDLINGELEDSIISNNQDLIKVISTVANVVYYFFKKYPNAIVGIEAVDNKRLRFYNSIFKRRYEEISQTFLLRGEKEGQIEPYSSNSYYEKFELELKK